MNDLTAAGVQSIDYTLLLPVLLVGRRHGLSPGASGWSNLIPG